MPRLFMTLTEAVSEINRDLAKAPTVLSTRVQHIERKNETREALNYEYSVDRGIPRDTEELLAFGAQHFSFWKEHASELREWLIAEEFARRYPDDMSGHLKALLPTEDLHPELKNMREGGAYGYSYQERMIGLRYTIANTLAQAETSRRAYWPIFQPQDAIRTGLMTRVPCTLGADFYIRQVPGPNYTFTKSLSMTLIQRSVDFSKFWLSDVYLWTQTQRMVAKDLGIPVGQFSHFIVSFHKFDDGLEIF